MNGERALRLADGLIFVKILCVACVMLLELCAIVYLTGIRTRVLNLVGKNGLLICTAWIVIVTFTLQFIIVALLDNGYQ